MAQNIVVETGNRGIALAAIRTGEIRGSLVVIGGWRVRFPALLQSPEITPRLAADAHHTRADTDTEAHTGRRDDSTDNRRNFHYFLTRRNRAAALSG